MGRRSKASRRSRRSFSVVTRGLFFFALVCIVPAASRATTLVVQFQNKSEYSDLNWVGESIADKLSAEFGAADVIVLDRSERSEAERQLELREGAEYTKASLIRLGQAVGADTVCFGNFTISLPPGKPALKDSSIRITAEFLDLRKMHLGPEFSEAGSLADLSRLEEHLAYESLQYLEPDAKRKLENFMAPQKMVRLEAEESYVRGLLSTNKEQRQKWFLQAAAVDNKFSGPAMELGKLAIEQKQYPQALDWLTRVPANDPSYAQARFKMGIAAYEGADFTAAVKYFQEVLQAYPLSEVYNNLGAAESQASTAAAAVTDLRHALEPDPQNLTYLFNLGLAQLRVGSFDDAARSFQDVLQHSAEPDATLLLDRARRRQAITASDKMPPMRLKNSFSQTAFQQLKAMLQTKK